MPAQQVNSVYQLFPLDNPDLELSFNVSLPSPQPSSPACAAHAATAMPLLTSPMHYLGQRTHGKRHSKVRYAAHFTRFRQPCAPLQVLSCLLTVLEMASSRICYAFEPFDWQ